MPSTLPDQRVSDSVKKTSEFYRPTYDYFITLGLSLNNRVETSRCMNAANGIINPKTFKDVISPFTANAEEVLPKLPGEIRDVDFVTPIKEKNLGEYLELPYKFFVKSENPDTAMKIDAQVREEIMQLIMKEFQTLVNNAMITAQETQQQPQLPDLKEYYEKRVEQLFNDKALEATHILSLINTETDFDTLRLQCYYNWWATEEFYTYREIVNGQLIKYPISPLNAYPITNGSQWIEDADAFVWCNKITYQQLLEKQARDKNITDKELDALNTLYCKNGQVIYSQPELIYSRIVSTPDLAKDESAVFAMSDNAIPEWNVIWKGQSKANELIYLDPYGIERRTIVPEDYVLNTDAGDIELNTIWIPKVFIGKRYGDENTGIYTIPKELECQRYDEETNSVKLPVGGKKGMLDGFALNPIPKRLISFLVVDKLLLLIIDREISKYLPYIKVIPQSVLNPDKAGTAKQKMAMLKADNTMIYDDTLVDWQTVSQGLRVINNTGLAEYLNTLWTIRKENKQDAFDAANMNNERFGNTANSQTVTNATQNIYRAKLGSVLMITLFNKAMELDHRADLEFSKYAYANGKKGTNFDKQTGEFVTVTIDPFEHINNKYFPVVVNSKIEEEKLQQLKDFAFSAAQNGDLDVGVEAIGAESVPEIKNRINAILDAKRKFDESIATRKEELTLEASKIQQQTAAAQIQADKDLQDSVNQTEIEKKYIDADIAAYKVDHANDGNNDDEEDTTSEDNMNREKSIIEKSKLRLAERNQKLKEDAFAHKKIMDDKNYKLKASKPSPTVKKTKK